MKELFAIVSPILYQVDYCCKTSQARPVVDILTLIRNPLHSNFFNPPYSSIIDNIITIVVVIKAAELSLNSLLTTFS